MSAVRLGFGRHLDQIPPQNLKPIFKDMYAAFILFNLGLIFPKLSALLFYERVFTADRGMKISRWVISALIVCWLQFRMPLDIWACVPSRAFWDHDVAGRCLTVFNSLPTYVAGGVWDCLLDLALLLLPIPRLWSLQMKRSRKIASFVGQIIAYYIQCLFCVDWSRCRDHSRAALYQDGSDL